LEAQQRVSGPVYGETGLSTWEVAFFARLAKCSAQLTDDISS